MLIDVDRLDFVLVGSNITHIIISIVDRTITAVFGMKNDVVSASSVTPSETDGLDPVSPTIP